MKRFWIVAAIGALALAASGCSVSTGPWVPTNPATPYAAPAKPGGVASKTLADERAMYAAEAAYNVAASAYVTADSNGVLTPAIKAKVKPYLTKAYAALKVARSAYAAGNTGDFFTAVADLETAANQAKALLKG